MLLKELLILSPEAKRVLKAAMELGFRGTTSCGPHNKVVIAAQNQEYKPNNDEPYKQTSYIKAVLIISALTL